MTTGTLMYFYCLAGGALLMSVLPGLVISAKMPGMDRESKRFFIASFSILLCSIIAYFLDLLVYSDPNLATVERIVGFFETILPAALLPLLTDYILHLCKEDWHDSAFFRMMLILWAVTVLLLCIAQFTESIYYITPDNQFVRGPWYPILIVPMIAMIVVDLAGVIHRRHKLTKKHFAAFLVYLLPSLAAMIIQAFMTAFLLIVIAVTLSVLSMLWIILTDQIEGYVHQQREISNQHAGIAVLQMRPHFIYNTMTSIYYLCEQNPQKAKQVTLDFTTYLRKNFNAIVSDNTISFSEELEHTRAYLAVEQALFEDHLFVEYDTGHTLFQLPALTLQPIVENAVKHGMDPDADEPLRILIRTAKTDSGNEIIVEDNGPGFSRTEDGEPHTALKNIRERLMLMCNGTLEIDSRETGGTRVAIRIP